MIKILFLAANPADTNELQLPEESRAIDQSLRMAAFRDSFDIHSHWAVHYADLPELLMRYKPDIVHFSGHGSSTGELIFVENNQKGDPVLGQKLGNIFSILKGNIRCVVLNACYSQIEAEAVAEHIDCVVGMSSIISDDTAIPFSTAFYGAIGNGLSVKDAFDLAVDTAKLTEPHLPQLIANHVDPRQVVFTGKSSQRKADHGIHFVTGNKVKFDLYESLLSDVAKLHHYPERIEEDSTTDLETLTKGKLLSAKNVMHKAYPKDPFFIEQFALCIDAWERLPAGLSSLFIHKLGCDKICLMMSRINEPERTASLEMRIRYSDGKKEVPFSDTLAGSIAREPTKVGNYLEVDTIFIPKEIPSNNGWIPNKEGKTLAELGEEKKKIWANLHHVVEFRAFLQRSKQSKH